jgi:hypothetical protein
MPRLVWRELIAATRIPALWVAVSAYVLLLAAFVLVWSDGVPVLDSSVFEQFVAVQWFAAASFAPWMACRLAGRREDVVILAALTARSASEIVLARAIATLVVIQALVVSGLPLGILAAAISDARGLQVGLVYGSLAALALAATAVSSLVTQLSPGRLTAWVVASMSVVIVAAAARNGVAFLAGGMVVSTVLFAAITARRTLAYGLDDVGGAQRT